MSRYLVFCSLPVSFPCLLSKDFQLYNDHSQGRKLGANSTGKYNIRITLFCAVLFPLNMKKKCFDRANYRALENKVNHCGRMPEVDKWGDGNVSTTSAICFLCWEVFILCLHCSRSLSALLPVFFCRTSPSPHPFSQSPAHFSPCILSPFLLYLGRSLPLFTCLAFSVRFYL